VELRQLGDGGLKGLGGTVSTQGVLVVAEIPDRTLADVTPGPRSCVLVLDGIQDPGNLGTLARSAAAFDCDAVLCMPGTVDPWNPKVVRAAAGALFRRPVVQGSWAEVDEWRDAHDYALLGADVAGDPVEPGLAPVRAALVVGNEGAGLSDAARSRCSAFVAVPMEGGTESLNVAVAGGILLYELTKGSR
jgi:TrmH family RNA methyltransferase